MNRTLTAAIALATTLGMAGMAFAQSNTSPSSSTQMNATSPSTTGTSGEQNPASMTGTTGGSAGMSSTQSPQANNMNQSGQQASQSEIQQAQQQLKQEGLYHGAVDGVMGPETQTAVMAFQRKHNLPQSAQLDQQTLSALSGGNVSNGSAGMTGNDTTGTQSPSGAARMAPGSSSTGTPTGTTGSSSYNR